MSDVKKLLGHWVEIREEGGGGRIVLRPFSSPIPPGRGRRGLVLAEDQRAEARGPSASDRTASTPGSWSFDGEKLSLDLSGWKGTYRVETVDDEKLVLASD